MTDAWNVESTKKYTLVSSILRPQRKVSPGYQQYRQLEMKFNKSWKIHF